MNWQPIETAPKDGSVILLWNGSRVFAGWWCELPAEWRDDRDPDYVEGPVDQPTRWAPWPEPPSV